MKWFAKNYYIEKSWLGNIECKFDGYNNFGNRRAANKWRLLMITQEENLKSIIEEIDFLKNSTAVSDIEECIAKTQELVSEGSTYTVPGEIIKKWIKSTIHKAFIE